MARQCASCGYDLRTHARGDVCPECRTTIRRSDAVERIAERAKRDAWQFVCSYVALNVVCLFVARASGADAFGAMLVAFSLPLPAIAGLIAAILIGTQVPRVLGATVLCLVALACTNWLAMSW